VRAIGVFFVLINVITLVGPVLGVVLAYQDNLKGLVVTPQVENMMSGGSFLTGGKFDLPQFVSATPDLAGRTVSLVFEFTNPFDYDLTVKSISADIVCSEHGFLLGHASLAEPTNIGESATVAMDFVEPTLIPAGATAELNIRADWTEEAEVHFRTEHPGAPNIDAKIVGLKINVNDITVESNAAYPISVPTGGPIDLPEFVSATPDTTGRKVTLVLKYTNSFDYTLDITAISADIECSLHSFTLGHASLVQPVKIAPGTTGEVTILCEWTEEAVEHFHAEHPGAATLAAKVVDVKITVNGAVIQSDQAYPVDVPIS
jgi:hypothetical protein